MADTAGPVMRPDSRGSHRSRPCSRGSDGGASRPGSRNSQRASDEADASPQSIGETTPSRRRRKSSKDEAPAARMESMADAYGVNRRVTLAMGSELSQHQELFDANGARLRMSHSILDDNPAPDVRKSMHKRMPVINDVEVEEEEEEEEEEEQEEEEEEDENVRCGIMLDTFKRRGQAQDIKVMMIAFKETQPGMHDYIRDAILREEFLGHVWDDITDFYKNPMAVKAAGNKGKPWPKTTTADIRDIVTGILAYKREVLCFNTEVHNHMLSYKLLNTHVHEKFETVRERHNRMEEFWTQYRKRLRRNALPPIGTTSSRCATSSGASSPSATSSGWRSSSGSRLGTRSSSRSGLGSSGFDAPSRCATSSGWRTAATSQKRPMCFADDEQWDMIERIENQSQRKQDCLSRPITHHGHPEHGMTVMVDSGDVRWQVKNPAEGSRASLMHGTHQHTSKPIMSDASTTPVNQKFGCGIVGMGKSASAPNFKVSSKASQMLLPGIPGAGKSGSLPLKQSGKQLPPIGVGHEPMLTDGPTNSYLETCQRCWITPIPLPFVTGHSWRLQAAGRDMTDSDLRAVASMLKETSCIEEVDLSGNNLLTEKALVPFMERLFDEPAASTLQKLILKDLKHIGTRSMDVIRNIISADDGARNLRVLDLSHVHINPKCHLKLATAVQDHSQIESINLTDTSLGNNSWIAKQCVGLLMSKSVKTLDLGWNCFDVEVFQHLGECLTTAAGKKLEAISVSNCCAATVDVNTPPPITFFLECLAQNTTLTYLDVSLNRMDFRAMLIIEDSFSTHQQLTRLDINSNPLGLLGMRSALRLITIPSNKLTRFDSTGCYSSSDLGAQTFNMTNPGGSYSLDLTRPYHRTILRMLYKICERFKQPPEQSFFSVKASKAPWIHASKDSAGRFEVPTQGTVSFVFNIESAIENAVTGIADDDFEGFTTKHSTITKIQPGFKKVIPMFACWKQLTGNAMDQDVFLNAMSKDFVLKPSHIEHMCTSSPDMRSEILFRLMPSVTGGETSESLCMMLFQSVGEFVRMHRRMRNFIDFNIENPTGHYKLDLASCTDYAIAEKLLLLDRWEVVLGRRPQAATNKPRQDVSQRGNRSHIRNEHHNNSPIQCKNIAEWTLPEENLFEFDYASGKRCPVDAAIINDQTFANILVSLYDAKCTPEAKVEALRQVAHFLFMSALHLRALLGSFKEERHRAEVFVTFFCRVVDMWNAKIFRVRFSDPLELKGLQNRLGYATFFPFIQPENAAFDLDYRYHDQKVCANILLQLGCKEGLFNIREPQFTWADGTVDPLPLGVPRSWEILERMPSGGVFKATYLCAPENRKFAARTGLAQTFAALPMDVQYDEVMWWTGLTEVTEDVLDLLEFCVGRFKSMDDAFIAIDGPDGNGQISLREFEEGLEEMECKKFAGKDEKQRISAIFRYLDPGGEGSVSREEWGILDQLWKEFQLCIKEFVHFLLRTFGDDLTRAWDALDDDGSGELDLDEWMKAVDTLGYFGPAKCVFALLDNSDDGNISIDEFMVLDDDKYKK